MKLAKKITTLVTAFIATAASAQEITADVQIRPRYEYTNGFGTLLTPTTSHTSFIGQRSRLNLNFTDTKLSTKLAMQSVRTWGDVPTIATIPANKNTIAVFEAWAKYNFTEKFSAKLGRQILSYDNQRIIGALDWANQGRSFDAALFIFKGKKAQLDLGFSLNEESEAKIDAPTVATTDYKNLQYAWYHINASKKIGISLLALNVGTEYQKYPNVLETNYRQTFGTYTNFTDKKFTADASIYGQTGRVGRNQVSAWQGAINLGFAITPKIKTTLGYEFLSGKDQTDSSTEIKSFAPLFGTNHAFNGFMDYFYVGNHANSVGLQDLTLKLEFPIKKVNIAIQPHAFMIPNKLAATDDNFLGTEIDLTAVYKFNKDITVIGGYSQLFATKTMVALKGGLNETTNNWVYVMININPQLLSFKK